MKKQVWFDARETSPQDGVILPYIYNSNLDTIVVKAENRSLYKAPMKSIFVVDIKTEKDLEQVKKEDILMSDNEALLKKAHDNGNKTCIYLTVNDKESLENAWKIGLNYNYVVIEFESETNIPLELVIARLQKTNTTLLKKVDNASDAEIAFGVMEHGSDGVMLSTKVLEEVVMLQKTINKYQAQKVTILPGKVKQIEHIGMGHRACIDTTSLMQPNEGMIIGSLSQGGILVSSETHFLPYMNLRPFRVNAGAVHSYVWCPNNTTEYITDLKSGSKVLVIDNEGNAREVSVGRIKTEVRPLLKITVEVNEIEISTIVQDDWHIRVLGINGEPYNASCLTPGTILAAYVCEPGRHVGIKIDESILEK